MKNFSEELISIIIPIYNVEKFLDKCIKSIVNQTYKVLEIILIDDGSTDNSGKLCDDWKNKDNRIKVIHKENGGVSDSRNVGIKSANGKYIFFIDSDDYVDLTIIEDLYKNILEKESNISVSGYILETYLKNITSYCGKKYTLDSENAIKELLEGKRNFVLWGKLYKKELFENIEFPVSKIHEDVATLYLIYDKAKKISYIENPEYHYVQVCYSIENGEFTNKHLSVISFAEDIIKFVAKKYPNMLQYAENYWIRKIVALIILCKKNNMKDESKFLKGKLRKNIFKILKNPKVKIKLKIKSLFYTII